MKTGWTIAAFALLVSLSSCEVIGGIFKAGMGFGIFLVLFVIALIVFLVLKAKKK